MVNVSSTEFRAYRNEQEIVIKEMLATIEKLKEDNIKLANRVNELEHNN